MQRTAVAHYRQSDKTIQSVKDHLNGVACISGKHAAKIGLAEAGELLGLLHDMGKYSELFQLYIQSSTELLNPDIDDEFIEAASFKGKIDHSTAGAQWIWQRLGGMGTKGQLIGQILAVCLASHHGGMLDCLQKEGENGFLKRVGKDESKTHLTSNSNFDINRLLSLLQGGAPTAQINASH